MATLHTKVSIKVDKVGLVVTAGQYVVEEGVCWYAVASVGGASCEETELEAITSGEHREAVAMGMASRFRGIPHLPCHVIGVSLVFIWENLWLRDYNERHKRRITCMYLISSVYLNELFLSFWKAVLIRMPAREIKRERTGEFKDRFMYLILSRRWCRCLSHNSVMVNIYIPLLG